MSYAHGSQIFNHRGCPMLHAYQCGPIQQNGLHQSNTITQYTSLLCKLQLWNCHLEPCYCLLGKCSPESSVFCCITPQTRSPYHIIRNNFSLFLPLPLLVLEIFNCPPHFISYQVMLLLPLHIPLLLLSTNSHDKLELCQGLMPD